MHPGKIRLIALASEYSMSSYERLANVYDLSTAAVTQGLDGAFVECGVWRGGCAGIMADIAHEEGEGRRTWLFDSFEGLPEPSALDGQEATAYASGRQSGELEAIDMCVGPIEDVRELLHTRLRVPERQVEYVKGWFQDTVEAAAPRIGPVAMLRLDGDWYDSTMVCLTHLYDLVVEGGFVVIDDYGHWEGCRRAVDEFLADREIEVALHEIDYTGRYFVKPPSR